MYVCDVSHLLHMGADGDAKLCESLQGKTAGNAERGGESSGKMAAASDIVPVSVAYICRPIGMTRTGNTAQFAVISRTGVGVFDDGGKGRSARVSVGDSAQYMDDIRFAAGGRGIVFAWRATIAKRLKRLQVNGNSGRQAVQRATDGRGMRLSKNTQKNAISEGRRHRLLLNERNVAAQKSVVIEEIGVGFVDCFGSVDDNLGCAA